MWEMGTDKRQEAATRRRALNTDGALFARVDAVSTHALS